MADETKQPHISDAQRKQLTRWASKNIPRGQCPWCLGVAWQIGDPIILPAYLAGSTELVLLPITCERCAYVRFHSARQMGFVTDT